uniref:Uncharacterized protein n=1 Tax=Arundo donax TaxID=35708 RepID=A0A0A9BSU2_ARUDO
MRNPCISKYVHMKGLQIHLL